MSAESPRPANLAAAAAESSAGSSSVKLGRRRGLLIGINYVGQPRQLRGCINDARNMSAYLIAHCGFTPGDLVVLTDEPTAAVAPPSGAGGGLDGDDATAAAAQYQMRLQQQQQRHAMNQPTRANITRAMRWLVRDARPGDALFFMFAGHGGQTDDESAASRASVSSSSQQQQGHSGAGRDQARKRSGKVGGGAAAAGGPGQEATANSNKRNNDNKNGDDDAGGDETDGYDELIHPVDSATAGHITDDEMHRILVRPLRAGVRLTAVFDSCHSGTALDLPYVYSSRGLLKEHSLLREAGRGLMGALGAYRDGDLRGIARSAKMSWRSATRGEEAYERGIRTRASMADVVMFSSARDEQTAADVAGDTAQVATATTTTTTAVGGALSWAFVASLKENPDQSNRQLLKSIRNKLGSRAVQRPQMSCSHPLDTSLPFTLMPAPVAR